MQKGILFKLTIIMYAIFIVSTIALIFIIYKDIDSPFIMKFVIGYVIFLVLFSLYIITVTIRNMKKLKWIDIRKSLVNFILWFIALSVFMYITKFLFNRPSKGVFGDLAIPLGSSLGYVFLIYYLQGTKIIKMDNYYNVYTDSFKCIDLISLS